MMMNNGISNLPAQTTALIGRDQHINDIRRLLHDADCRLLTLVGPGGVGKTRLAIAVAEGIRDFRDGVAYVPLQTVTSTEFLAAAIAEAIGITHAGHEPLPRQLLRYLHTKQLLLVLDNFEQLLAETDLLVELLQQAPHIKLIVTSREDLSVPEEWRYPVTGLTVPTSDGTGDPTAYAAPRMFAQRARRILPDFDLGAEASAVVAICKAVEGMPLAIELAASWLTVLDCAAIAARLQGNFDILTSPLRNMPSRHRSMVSIFDQSWQMLTQQERNTFMQLTVFQGDISYPAAEKVAGATLPSMAALVAKSLVRREGNGCYHIHELLRQYGLDRLAASPEIEQAVHRAHGVYFMQFLADFRPLFYDSRQRQAAQDIGGELDNIRQAWHWALDHLEIEWLYRGGHTLYSFAQSQGRYLEAIDLLQETSRRLALEHMTPAYAAAQAVTLTNCAWLSIRLGRLVEADDALRRVSQLSAEFRLTPGPRFEGDTLLPSMFLELARGNYEQASILGNQILRRAPEHAAEGSLWLPHYGLASAAFHQGDYTQAKVHAETALAMATASDHQRAKIFPLGVLGQVALVENDLLAAKRYFESAYAIADECAARGGIAENLENLAGIALQQQEWQVARTQYARSQTVYSEIGDRGGVARTQLGIGNVCQRTDERAAAARHYRLALAVAAEAHIEPIMLSIAAAVGDFLLQSKDTSHLGRRILTFVLRSPVCDGQTRKQVLNSFAQAAQTPDEFQPTLDVDDMTTLISVVQAALTVPTDHSVPSEPLIEPLTPRECEILRQLASGRSNPEIAALLIIAEGTVKAHTSRIFRKLEVTNRTQAVVRAREIGLLA